MIDNGIKQPLRFYDSLDKQNYQRDWVLSGLERRECVICPKNAIIPFQVRRRKSAAVITVFDAYKWDGDAFIFDTNILGIIPAPQSNHLKIIQMQKADNVCWSPRAAFTSNLDCGFYYVHLSDGTVNWYSEVFYVDDFTDTTTGYITILDDIAIMGTNQIAKSSGNPIITSSKPY